MLTEQIIQSLRAVREQKPLVVNITNWRSDEQHGQCVIGDWRFAYYGALTTRAGRDDVFLALCD